MKFPITPKRKKATIFLRLMLVIVKYCLFPVSYLIEGAPLAASLSLPVHQGEIYLICEFRRKHKARTISRTSFKLLPFFPWSLHTLLVYFLALSHILTGQLQNEKNAFFSLCGICPHQSFLHIPVRIIFYNVSYIVLSLYYFPGTYH